MVASLTVNADVHHVRSGLPDVLADAAAVGPEVAAGGVVVPAAGAGDGGRGGPGGRGDGGVVVVGVGGDGLLHHGAGGAELHERRIGRGAAHGGVAVEVGDGRPDPAERALGGRRLRVRGV